jgi:triphosphoribosyl-dephospho-CoA synthase
MSRLPDAPPRAAAADVAALAQIACLLEVSAPKPGNVSPVGPFHDARYEDFLASAVAIGPALAGAAAWPLGVTIRTAVEATRRWTATNTNLGIVLLLVPLARAALTRDAGSLRDALRATLADTTVADAQEVYAAIRLASPGGLGSAPEQDVARPPTVSLLEAMALARERDAIAREYVTGFDTVFGAAVPALCRARADGLAWSDAIVHAYLTLLAAAPDTHIARKLGAAAAGEVQRRARVALDAGGMHRAAGRVAAVALDRALRDPYNRQNPGATADLTTAAIFVTLLEGGWPRRGEGDHAGA